MRAAWWLASYGPLPWPQRAIFYLGVAFFAATREHLYCVFKYPKGLESLTTCLIVILLVAATRKAVELLITRYFRKQLPDALAFPAWSCSPS